MKYVPLIILALLTMSSCHTQQHTVTSSDNHTQQSAVTNSTQVVNAFDSLLHQLDFTADSVVVILSPEPTQSDSLSSSPVIRLTAHRPHLTTQSTQTTQTTQTTSEAQTTNTTQTSATTQTTDKTQTVIAAPMNGTAVVITIAIALLLILAALAYFFLKKYKII